MTWSIIGRDAETGFYGIAIASRFFSVGTLCPWLGAGVGAISTQALVNPSFGPDGLALLRQGHAAAAVLDRLIGADEGRSVRQVHLMDAQGRTAAHTGEACVDWAGHRHEDAVSVAGNMLAGAGVIDATLGAYKANLKAAFVERLLGAMQAGEAAGGDKRGKQSAALVIQGAEPYPRLSLRADDHPDPLAELRRLYAVARQHFIPFCSAFPTPERPSGITDRAVLDKIIARDAGKHLDLNPPATDA